MPSLPPGAVLQHIRQVLEAPGEDGQLDQELLKEFASRRDESAFAALLRRHGQLVLGVCRRVLGNCHDAEDVFQATFLVLARKAGSIRKHGSVGSWLHGVAYRLATKERMRASRRRREEMPAAEAASVDPATDLSWRELQAVLDEELNRLSDKFRAPLLLCYLEGKTQDEAARQLGWSLGTFRRRLDQARELLRGRLVRRGLALSAVLFPVLLGQSAAGSAPIPLLVSTLQAASAFALGEAAALGVVSAKVVILAEEVMKAMLLNKLKFAAAAVVVVAGLAGTGTVVHHYAAAATARETRMQPPARTVAKLVPKETESAPDLADREMIESLLKFPNQVPALLSTGKEKPYRFEDFPRFQRKALQPYLDERPRNDALQQVYEGAIKVLNRTDKSFADTIPLVPENQQKRTQFIRSIADRQMMLAEVYAQLEASYEEVKSLENLRVKDTPRWQANIDYATARLLFRMTHFFEYQVMLGKVRKDDLPPVDKKKHKGYRLAAVAAMGDLESKKLAQLARKALERLAKDHKGTPWEVIAQREMKLPLGLEWQPDEGGK